MSLNFAWKALAVGLVLGIASIPISTYSLMVFMSAFKWNSSVSWILSAAITPSLIAFLAGFFIYQSRSFWSGIAAGLVAVAVNSAFDVIGGTAPGPLGLAEYATIVLVSAVASSAGEFCRMKRS